MISPGLLLLLSLPVSQPSRGPCTPGALPHRPPALSFEEGALGRPRPACLDQELGLSARGAAVIEPDNFYGDLRASTELAGRWLLKEDLELFASLELLRYETVISSLSAARLGLGHLSLGAAYGVIPDGDLALSGYVRTVLPTAFGLYEHAQPFALEGGVSVQQALPHDLTLHAGAAVLGSMVLGPGVVLPRAGLSLFCGIGLSPVDWVALVLGLKSQYFYSEIVDHVSIPVALRFTLGTDWELELGASVPVAGRERSLLAGALGLQWRL